MKLLKPQLEKIKNQEKKHIEKRKNWQSIKMTEYLLKEVFFNYIINVKLLNQETMTVDRSTDISDKDPGLNSL